jgi:hypothetical protein
MFNRKNNKKSKKTDSKNQNNINAFRIEQLEPRLLMSATAAEWQAELDTVKTVDSQVESIVNAHTDSFSEDIDGLYMTHPDTGVTRLAMLSDLANTPAGIKNLDWNSFASAVSDDMDGKIDALVTATVADLETRAVA